MDLRQGTITVGELLDAGVSRLLVDGTLLGPDEVASGVRHVVRAIEAARAGQRVEPRLKGATSGHLFSPIG